MQSVKQMLDGKAQGQGASKVHQVSPSDTVLEAIKQMAECSVGALVVIDQGKLVGIVSERDYARKVILQGKSSRETQVREIMSSPVLTTTLQSRARECMHLMTDKRIRHLPVVDGDQVVGMLSIGDLLKVVIAEQQNEIQQLSSYIHNS
jgi:CBS domain-containing protein